MMGCQPTAVSQWVMLLLYACYAFGVQVAHVQWHTVSQGVYVCANGGNCSAPDVCVCADGWIGFDCRIPVCKQGYHEPHLKHARCVLRVCSLAPPSL